MILSVHKNFSRNFVFQRSRKDGKDHFKSRRELFLYILELYKSQKGRCTLSGVFTHHNTTTDTFHDPFQMSVDAIKPVKGHKRGNLRIVCMFLNSTNFDKLKRYVAEDDHKYPSVFTREYFEKVFKINS